MSCRDLSQPSFAEALVTGYTQGRGFLEDIDRAFDWGAFGVLLAPIHGSTKGAPGYPPVTMFKIILFQQWCTLPIPRGGGSGARPVAVSPVLPPSAGSGDARSCLDLADFARSSTSWDCRRRYRPRPTASSTGAALSKKRGTLVDATIIAAAVRRPMKAAA
jgi:transposase, IS5 family